MTGGHIVVTGAASGIGQALCAQLRASGCRVTGLDIVAGASDANIMACDLTDFEAIKLAAASIDGPIDGLALVAGLPGTHDASRVFDVNFLSTRHVVAALAPKMVAGGAIVGVASIAGHRCQWGAERLNSVLDAHDDLARQLVDVAHIDGNAMYELSKRLLIAWGAHAAASSARQGIRVNIVSPGPVETPILRDFYTTMGEARMETARSIVGRHGEPEEIASVIAFLLSKAAAWINGVEIKVDGGMQAIRGVASSKQAD